MAEQHLTSGNDEAVILVKATPHVGKRHGETVCCAGINRVGKWLRLYPVAFRNLEDGQKFARWDLVKFRWRRATDDSRIESRRVDPDSIIIAARITSPTEREKLLEPAIVTSLVRERQADRSLALLKPEITGFRIVPKPDSTLVEERAKYASIRDQGDFFARANVPLEPCPYMFKYKWRDEDGDHEGTCQDWETEATFFKWSKEFGDEQALDRIQRRFGVEYPRAGMMLAMGTHSMRPDQWLINGVIRYTPSGQLALGFEAS